MLCGLDMGTTGRQGMSGQQGQATAKPTVFFNLRNKPHDLLRKSIESLGCVFLEAIICKSGHAEGMEFLNRIFRYADHPY